ncbi:RpsD [Ilyonectria robusta]
MFNDQNPPQQADSQLHGNDPDYLNQIDPEIFLKDETDDHLTEESDGYSTDEDDDPLAAFEEVLASVNLEFLPHFASIVRQTIEPGAEHKCSMIGEPMHGSFNILFPLDFDDGVRWLLRVPARGVKGKWDEMAASALTTEVLTMLMLKRETTIPLPEVFHFSDTTENSLRCPYILMLNISGLPLYNVWFGQHLNGVDQETLRSRRTQMLDDIASAMAQLEPYSYSSSGSVQFDSDWDPLGVGPVRQFDPKAAQDCQITDDLLYVDQPAMSDPEKFYTFLLDLHPETNADHGEEILLRRMISWIPKPIGPKPFVLAHPDFDVQNFIVSEDGHLQGIIDWDGIMAVPRSIGNEGYPGWLTRDWDPLMYGYKESMDDGVEPLGVWEDSPESLKYYRSVYRQSMLKARGTTESIDTTRMSLIAENLRIAAYSPACRIHILIKMVGGIFGTEGDEALRKCCDLVNAFAEDKVDESELAAMKDGFKKLLEMPM